MRIGVLALQGDFAEHLALLERIGVEGRAVRLPHELLELEGLIIPGGESTTIGKLAVAYGLIEPLRRFSQSKAVWGTCAGAIFLSKDLQRDQPLLGVMDIRVARNAFGRQVDSFETELEVAELSRVDAQCRPFHAVFIRAPIIEAVRGEARAIATLSDGRIVAARQGKLLATAFHPELTPDDRFHRFFVELARSESDL